MGQRRATMLEEILWGAQAIGEVIGRSTRATYHMLEQGLLPAKKVGPKLWCASRRKLLEALTGEDRPSLEPIRE
jgi:hypothetical protein